MTHTLTLQSIEPVTHDTYHLVFTSPTLTITSPVRLVILRSPETAGGTSNAPSPSPGCPPIRRWDS